MMGSIRANYALLLAAFAAAMLPAVAPFLAPLDLWLSLIALGLVVWVHRRLSNGDLRKAMPGDAAVARHVYALERTILLCLIGGVVTSFQWLLSLRQLDVLGYQRLILGCVSWGLFAAALLHPVIGLGLTYRKPGRSSEPPADKPVSEPTPPAEASSKPS